MHFTDAYGGGHGSHISADNQAYDAAAASAQIVVRIRTRAHHEMQLAVQETTVDQETGARGSQPLLALHKIRSGKILASGQAQFRDRPEWKHSVFFGCNLVTVRGGMLAVGDELHVTELQPNVQPTS